VLPTVVQNATFLRRTLLRQTKMQQAVLIICLLLIISYTAIIIYYAISDNIWLVDGNLTIVGITSRRGNV
jgi:hypothetical protein